MRCRVPLHPRYDTFFSVGLSQEQLRTEVFFLGYHLHWSWSELMDMESDERRVYVEMLVNQIERENARIEASRNQ
jgi:hypothetical protein